MFRLRLAGCALFCVLQGCGGGGGGGGGGGSPPPSDFRITLHQSSLVYDFYDTQTPLPQSVTATVQGTYTGTVYVGAIAEGSGINPVITMSIGATQATAEVSAAAGLAPGTYTGSILFLACSDAQCNNRIGGTPLPVSYTVTVRRGVRVNPAVVQLQAVAGETASSQIDVELAEGESTYDVSVLTSAELAAIVTGVQGPSSFAVEAAARPAGTYSAQFRVRSGGSTALLSATYTVTNGPGAQGFVPSPASLAFAADEGEHAPAQALQVLPPTWNPDGVNVMVEYLGGTVPAWLNAQPTGDGNYTVTASATELTTGDYMAQLVFATVPAYETFSVPVALAVGRGLVVPAQTTVTVTSDASQFEGSARIDRASGDPLQWTATTDAPWLTLTRTTGQTGTEVQFSVDPAAITGWDNFTDHVGQVHVEAPGVTPVAFDVRVAVRLAEVTGLGPYLLYAGQSSNLLVRGRGFTGVASPADRLRVDGNPVVSASMVSDTTLRVDVGALPVGQYPVSISNTLQRATQERTLKVSAPGTYVYSTTPTNTSIGGQLFFDPERQVAYASQLNWSHLRFDIASPGAFTVVTPGDAAGLALSADGAHLLSNGSENQLRLLDPDTLALLEAVTMPLPVFSAGLWQPSGGLVSSDGRVWSDVANGQYAFFDLNTRTAGVATVHEDASGASVPPAYVISRNGERIVGATTFSHASPQPLYYIDASSSVIRRTAAATAVFNELRVSDDGDRLLIDAQKVLNGQFATVGEVTVPDAAYERVLGLIAPDGDRAYVLAYATSEYTAPVPQLRPRVYVFDTSTPSGGTLPVLGHFEFDDYPSCLPCHELTYGTLTPDGRALLFVGPRFFVVVPVPPALTPVSAGAPLAPLNLVHWK